MEWRGLCFQSFYRGIGRFNGGMKSQAGGPLFEGARRRPEAKEAAVAATATDKALMIG